MHFGTLLESVLGMGHPKLPPLNDHRSEAHENFPAKKGRLLCAKTRRPPPFTKDNESLKLKKRDKTSFPRVSTNILKILGFDGSRNRGCRRCWRKAMLIKLSIDLLLHYEIPPLIELFPIILPPRDGHTLSNSELSFSIAGLVDESIVRLLCLLKPSNDGF